MSDKDSHPHDDDDQRAPYEPPAISVIATVSEATLGAGETNADGVGFSQ
jgi:hypothetical protein